MPGGAASPMVGEGPFRGSPAEFEGGMAAVEAEMVRQGSVGGAGSGVGERLRPPGDGCGYWGGFSLRYYCCWARRVGNWCKQK